MERAPRPLNSSSCLRYPHGVCHPERSVGFAYPVYWGFRHRRAFTMEREVEERRFSAGIARQEIGPLSPEKRTTLASCRLL